MEKIKCCLWVSTSGNGVMLSLKGFIEFVDLGAF